jgi:type II secretory ATPase GspE/PulE/Tfp pilus assembly ATPase PilB-like protein
MNYWSEKRSSGEEVVEHGMATLRQNGAQKVLDGITTIEEVFRVTLQ